MQIRQSAMAAEDTPDWSAELLLWSEQYANDPADRAALLGTIRALCRQERFAEAEAMFSQAAAEHANHIDYAICYAETAQLRASLGEAVERNLQVLRKFPDQIYGYAASAILLVAARCVEQAADILHMGHACFGDAFELMLPDVHLAIARQEWPAAAATLARMRGEQPEQLAFVSGIAVLESVVEAALASQALFRAVEAERSGDFDGALDAWRAHAQTHGGSRETALAITRCHRALGDVAAAEHVLARATLDYPADPEIAAFFAFNAEAANQWPLAATRWREVVRSYPEHTAFAAPASIALARDGAVDEAEALLAQMIAREPASLDLRTSHAIVAQFGGDWQTAVNRWRLLIDLSPDNETVRNLHGEAIWHLGPDRVPDPTRQAPQPIGQVSRDATQSVTGLETDDSLAEIMVDFESVGDNCEFGLVQRHFGAEPVCLFRFSALQPADLITLLNTELEPLGDPAHTVIFEEGNEYIVKDDRGYYWMHSFLRIGQADPVRYLKQQRARILLLKRKFLTDLRSGTKIYVCKQSQTQISDETLHAVSRSLRAFGDNMLLGVRRADADHPSGSVERLNQNILVGYVATLFGGSREDVTDHGSWKQIIKTSHTMMKCVGQPAAVVRRPLEAACL